MSFGSAVWEKTPRRPHRMLVAALVILIVLGMSACSSHNTPQPSANRKSGGSGGTGNTGNTTQATAPPGSSQSFSDGYLSVLSGCLPRVTDLSTQTCTLIPHLGVANGDAPYTYCTNWISIGNANNGIPSLPPGDNEAQWLAGCEAVVSKASFGAGPSGNSAAGTSNSGNPGATTTTPFTAAQQKFVNDVESQIPSARGVTGAYPLSTFVLLTGQHICSDFDRAGSTVGQSTYNTEVLNAQTGAQTDEDVAGRLIMPSSDAEYLVSLAI